MNLTRYAKKFGEAPLEEGFPAGKSGLTPLSPLNPASRLMSLQDRDARSKVEKYQGNLLKGYTTALLSELDAISNRQLNQTSLNCPLHPLLQRGKWRQTYDAATAGRSNFPPYIIAGTANEEWLAGNDRVWNIMLPCLRLTSIMLRHFITKHPWFDAFMLGPRSTVPEDRFSAEDKLHTPIAILQLRNERMDLRNPPDSHSCQAAFNKLQSDVLMKNLEYDFMSCKEYPNRTPNPNLPLGLTATNRRGKIRVFLSYEKFEILFRTDLNDAERLADQFGIANTILHETIHAIAVAQRLFNGTEFNGTAYDDHIAEPYFDDESVAELGWSAENALYGGPIDPFLKLNAGFTLSLALSAISWPDTDMSTNPTLIIPPLPDEWIVPITVSFSEAMQNQGYWNVHVRSMGMLRPTVGRTISASLRDSGIWKVFWRGPQDPANMSAIDKLVQMTPAQKQAHSIFMRDAQVLSLEQMIAQRLSKTKAVIAADETCQRAPNVRALRRLDDKEKLVAAMEALIVRQEAIVNYLGRLVAVGQDLVDTRNRCQSFNRGFRRVIRTHQITLVPANDPFVPRLQALLLRLETLRLALASPSDLGGVSLQGDLTQSAQDEINDTATLQLALNTQDEVIAERHCTELVNSVGCNLYVQTVARARLGYLMIRDRADRIADLQRAHDTLACLNPPDHFVAAHADLKLMVADGLDRTKAEVLREILMT